MTDDLSAYEAAGSSATPSAPLPQRRLGNDPAVRADLDPAVKYFRTLVSGVFTNASPRIAADG